MVMKNESRSCCCRQTSNTNGKGNGVPGDDSNTRGQHANAFSAVPEYGTQEWERTYHDGLKAVEWVAANQDAWEKEFVIPAQNAKAANRKFRIQTGIQNTVSKDYIDAFGNDSKICHTFARAFGRILESEHPELKGCITFRKSRFDAEGMPWCASPIAGCAEGMEVASDDSYL